MSGLVFKEAFSYLRNPFSLFPLSLNKEIKLGLPYNQCLKHLNEFNLNKTVLNYIFNLKLLAVINKDIVMNYVKY